MTVRASAVGEPAPLQAALEHLPPSYDLTVEEIGTYRGGPGVAGATLSDRQREVVAAALAAGYYDRPRGTTHEELAARLDCAPATVSEHLQKAEAAVMEAAMTTRASQGRATPQGTQ
jgi:predicted DNA binding protein